MAVGMKNCRIMISNGNGQVYDITGYIYEASIGINGDGTVTWELRGNGYGITREENKDEFIQKTLPEPDKEDYVIL